MSKHIVITGVSRGLGRVMTEAFIAQGHRVSGCARNVAKMVEFTQAYPTPHRFMAMQSSRRQSCEPTNRNVIAGRDSWVSWHNTTKPASSGSTVNDAVVQQTVHGLIWGGLPKERSTDLRESD